MTLIDISEFDELWPEGTRPRILTDKQWAALCRDHCFPETARPHFDLAIDYYRTFLPSAETLPMENRMRFRRLRDSTEMTIRDIECLMNDEVAFRALSMGASGCSPYNEEQMADERGRLERARCELLAFKAWLSEADNRVIRKRPGRRQVSGDSRGLVDSIDEIFTCFLGRPLSRKQEDHRLVWAVCQIANPKLGEHTVTQAIKDVIWGRSHGPSS